MNKDNATVEMDANVINPLRFIDLRASLKKYFNVLGFINFCTSHIITLYTTIFKTDNTLI